MGTACFVFRAKILSFKRKFCGAFSKISRQKSQILPRNFFEFSGKLKNLLRESQKSAREHFQKCSAVISKFPPRKLDFAFSARTIIEQREEQKSKKKPRRFTHLSGIFANI